MRRFLRNIGLFLLLVLVANILFSLAVSRPAIYKRYMYNRHSLEHYSLFLLGDSHAAFLKGVPGAHGIFNFAYVSDNYLDMYMKAKYLASVLDEGDTLLIPADRHTLSEYRDSSVNFYRSVVYTDFDTSGICWLDIPSDFNRTRLKLLQWLPLLDVNFSDLYRQHLRPFGTFSPGDFSKLSPENRDLACSRRRLDQFPDRASSDKQKKYLERTIGLCRDKGIVLIGVRFPVSPPYWEYIRDRDYGAAAIIREHGIPVIDLQDNFLGDTSMFYDQDHLNERGADVFCSLLLESLH